MFKKTVTSLVATAVITILSGTAFAGSNSGPLPIEIDQYLADKPDTLKPLYRTLFVEGTRNAVLNNVRLGVAAMQVGEYARAESAFDAALAQIETVYADDPRAKQARSVWSKEAVKDFKGEPYERAMAYYYRGLLYLRAADYENARASFIQAEYQSTLAENEEYVSAFPMMDYLAGWASHCADNAAKAQEFFTAASSEQPSLQAPAATHDVLLVAELGSAPVKYAGGKSNELLQFKAADGNTALDASFSITLDASGAISVPTSEAASISWQATHRGGRAVQAVLDGKAQFKDGMDTAAEVSSTTGLLAMNVGAATNDLDIAGAGAILGLAGVAMSFAAQAAKPDADVRAWDNLPDSIRVATIERPQGNWTPAVSADMETPARRLDDGSGKCSIVWTRSDSATAIAASAPGTELTPSEQRKLERKFGEKDRSFRSSLLSQNL